MSTKTELKQWRTLQIAAQIIYRIAGNVRIEAVPRNEKYDLLVSLLDEHEAFGVKVANSTYTESAAYQAYVDFLKQNYKPSKNEFIPILLMCVNETQETAQIGMQVSWLYNSPRIQERTKLHSATPKMWPKILDMLNSTYDTVRVVSLNNVSIVRNIEFETHDNEGVLLIGNVIYLRETYDGYNIEQRDPETDEERIESKFNMIRQDEYPNDDLDKAIQQAFEDKFENVKPHRSILLLSSDIRELERQIDRPNTTISIPILPKYDPVALQLLNGMHLPVINVKVYGLLNKTIDVVNNTPLEVEHDVKDFIPYCANIEQLKKTLKNPDEVVLV